MDEKTLNAIRSIMREELVPIHTKLDAHSTILDSHSTILEKHSTILESHSSTLGEHSQLLKALEHHALVTRAEQDKLIHDVAHLQGDITEIKRDMYRMEEATASNWVDIVKLKAAK